MESIDPLTDPCQWHVTQSLTQSLIPISAIPSHQSHRLEWIRNSNLEWRETLFGGNLETAKSFLIW